MDKLSKDLPGYLEEIAHRRGDVDKCSEEAKKLAVVVFMDDGGISHIAGFDSIGKMRQHLEAFFDIYHQPGVEGIYVDGDKIKWEREVRYMFVI